MNTHKNALLTYASRISNGRVSGTSGLRRCSARIPAGRIQQIVGATSGSNIRCDRAPLRMLTVNGKGGASWGGPAPLCALALPTLPELAVDSE